jgi:hypothetical protein
MKRINNRGTVGDQLMIFQFLFLLFIVGIGIVAGVAILYGGDYDSRKVEAEILNYRVKECFLANEKISDDFFGKCDFDQKIIEKYYKIRICEGEDYTSCAAGDSFVFSSGSNFQACFLNEEGEEKLLNCEVSDVKKDGQNFVILTSSSQIGRTEI